MGNSEAMVNVAYLYKNNKIGNTINYSKVIDWLNKAIRKKNTRAYYALANMYLNGEGLNKNADSAYSYFKKAADSNNFA